MNKVRRLGLSQILLVAVVGQMGCQPQFHRQETEATQGGSAVQETGVLSKDEGPRPDNAEGIEPADTAKTWQELRRQSKMKEEPDRSNWRQLRRGMSFSDVKQLLGEPRQVRVSGSATYWYYPNILGASVTFYENRVDGWEEP